MSIQIPNGEFKQLVEPKQINNFWEWLFNNQHRVGNVKDYYTIPDISFLLLFLGKIIVNNKEEFTIESINAVEGGAHINLKDKNGAIVEVKNKKKSQVLDVGDCEKWFRNRAFTP